MHILRTSSSLARLILAWFVLTLGVAVASPLIHQQSMELVCSGGSIKLVMINDDGQPADVDPHALECPLCLPAALASSTAPIEFDRAPPLANAPHPFIAAQIAALAGAPLPPRGPPSLA